MPALIPSSLTNDHDFGQVLSAYLPDKQAFKDLWNWLESSCTEEQPESSCTEEQPAREPKWMRLFWWATIR